MSYGRVGQAQLLDERFDMAQCEREVTVVLIPGLWMPAWVMRPLAWRLRALGYRRSVTFGYASMRASLDENVETLARFIRGLGEEAPICLVGHSLGGVLALQTTASRGLVQVRRIVMAGSPYSDTYAGRRLARYGWGRWLLGRTVPQWLGCEKPSAPQGVDVGVIAGTTGIGLGLIVAPDLARPHDGVIRVAETALPGMAAYVEVPVSHAGFLLSKQVARLVAGFLRSGRFEAAANRAPEPAQATARSVERGREQ